MASKRIFLIAIAVAGCLTAGTWAVPARVSAAPVCPTVSFVGSAGNCGISITKAGCYRVVAYQVAASDTADCISIGASSVNLDLAGFSLTGTGATNTAAGVHVLPGFTNINVVGNAATGGSDIQQFNTGVLLESISTRLDYVFSEFNNGDGIRLNKVRTGVLGYDISEFNGGNGVTLVDSVSNQIADSAAENNTGSGIVLSGSNSNSIGLTTAQDNTVDGIDLLSVSAANILSGDVASGNGNYGIWISGSAANRLGANTVTGNTTTDIYLGCSSNGPNPAVTCAPNANANRLDSNSPGSIVVDNKALANQVIDNFATGALTDNNTKCASNVWFGNSGTPSQACIH